MARTSQGLRVRLKAIHGETPKGVLRKPLYLPAVMRGFGWTEEFGHTEYDTLRAGQFSQPGVGPATARRLRVADDMETLQIQWEPAWLVERGVDPERVRAELSRIGRSRKAVELLVIRNHGVHLLRMKVTIRTLVAQIREGEPDTIYWTLRISEWRDPTSKKRGSGTSPKLPTTHELKHGDTLSSLSKHYYGSYAGWRAIAEANGIRKWGQHTELVKLKRYKVGSKIKIPKKPPIAHI